MVAVRIVLMRPRNGENVAAAARAMRNFGLADWRWVDPNPALLAPEAPFRKLAVHAQSLLDPPPLASSLEEAVADCHWVVATCMRQVEGRPKLSPVELAEEARARGGRLALVFGDERNGLRTTEVQRCHALSAIPTAPEQASLNLAQAVLLYGYELRRAALAEGSPATGRPAARAATDAQLASLEGSVRDTLRRAGFLQGPERHAVRDLMGPWLRARLTEKEARLWSAVWRALEKRLPGR